MDKPFNLTPTSKQIEEAKSKSIHKPIAITDMFKPIGYDRRNAKKDPQVTVESEIEEEINRIKDPNHWIKEETKHLKLTSLQNMKSDEEQRALGSFVLIHRDRSQDKPIHKDLKEEEQKQKTIVKTQHSWQRKLSPLDKVMDCKYQPTATILDKTPKGCYTRLEWILILKKQTPIEKLDKKKVRNSFINGIPDDFRGQIWKLICQVNSSKRMHSSEMYSRLLEQPNEEDEFCINKDLGRTITGFQGFKIDPASGKNKLFNLLKAYSNFDIEIGYCQGINYLAALFILNIDDEIDAFWCLIYLLMGPHNWREIFNEKTTKLMELLDTIEKQLKKKNPKVLKHLLETTQLNIPAAFSSLFITLFIYDLPQETATTIFELFLLDGEKLLIKLLLKMIKLKEKTILQLEEFELLKYIRSDMIIECLSQYPLKKLLG